MLGYTDLDNLSPEQSTRLDIATALRVLLDHQSGRLLRGESLDARELLLASDALAKILPPLREPAPVDNVDPRQVMWETYLGMRKRGEIADPVSTHEGRIVTVEKLRAEVASKDARIAELEAALAGSVPLPPNAVKLHNDNPVRLSATAPAAPPQPAPPPPAQQPTYDYNREEGWKSYVEPTGEIRSSPRGRWDT
jgi:hypothetical protein